MATIFAWSGALKKRGELDGNAPLVRFGEKLEQASIATIAAGIMTKDLAGLWEKAEPVQVVATVQFLREIRTRLETLLGG